MPRVRPALVILLLSFGDGSGGCCWLFSGPKPRLRLTGTLMVVFDLCKGTGLIWSTLATNGRQITFREVNQFRMTYSVRAL